MLAPVLAVLLIALTAWRLARLIAKDEFPPSAALRDRVAQWAGTGSVPHYLVQCVPCAGVYTSGIVVAGTHLGPGIAAPLLAWGAAAALVTLINTAERTAEAATHALDPEPADG